MSFKFDRGFPAAQARLSFRRSGSFEKGLSLGLEERWYSKELALFREFSGSLKLKRNQPAGKLNLPPSMGTGPAYLVCIFYTATYYYLVLFR